MSNGEPAPGLGTRRISFPPEAVFQSVIQDSDNNELWLILNALEHTGVDIDKHNHAGITPLHQCVLNNNLDGVKMLMNFGADVNMADIYGLTPLHTASACGFLQVASILIIYGADIFSKANDGDLPVDFAKDTEMAQLLQAQMIASIHSRQLVKSCVLYYCRQWALWILRASILLVGRLLDFIIGRLHVYTKHKWQKAEANEQDNSHEKNE
ncbi:hypothetical protein LSH36_43g03012 [Paralvinella palmiformis]|uniref:Uncharacterized protein n=1 Tax=Paralvinella palmiformis TaxID=53620 RepID=A0AAD9K721_9ANNE|nr:hypothetical protein LSH36_43g03012 [Paralvinella palmiformis]